MAFSQCSLGVFRTRIWVKSIFTGVEFPSEGVMLRGRLYLPHITDGSLPMILMTHGFSATISGMTADIYAEMFCEAGFAVLLFDHKSFGLSDGEPRCEINRWAQARGYIHALDFVTTLPEIDHSKIALWGDSYSGNVALLVGSIDPRVHVIVVQVPACGSEAFSEDIDGSKFNIIKETLLYGDVTSHDSIIGPLPVVSSDQLSNPSALEPITAFKWFIQYGGQFETNWKNIVTIVNPRPKLDYHVGYCAPHVKVPLLMVVSPHDEMPGAQSQISRLVFDCVQGPKEWVEIDGGHFGLLYYPSPIFNEVSTAQISFLNKYFR